MPIEKETISVKTNSLERHSIEYGKSRPAHEKNEAAQSESAVFKVAPALPLAVGKCCVDDLLKFLWGEIVGRLNGDLNLLHPL